MFLFPSMWLSHGWVWRGSAIHMLLWLEPSFICRGKCWKHLPHKLAIWRLENSILSSWFKRLGKAWLGHKDLEAFCLLMLINFRCLFRVCVALWMAQLDNLNLFTLFGFFHSPLCSWSRRIPQWLSCRTVVVCSNLDFFLHFCYAELYCTTISLSTNVEQSFYFTG